MLGLAVYNSSLIQKKVNYVVMPLYSFGQNRLNGTGTINLNFLPRKNMGSTIFSFQVARFEKFKKYEPSLTFNLPRASVYSPDQQLRFSSTHVSVPIRRELNGPDAYFEYNFAYTIPSVQYQISSKNAVKRISAQVAVDVFVVNRNSFTNLNPVLGKITLEYDRQYRPGKWLQTRFFAGKFFNDQPLGIGYDQFRLGLSSSQDYKKETIFLDRAQRSSSLTAFVHQTDNRDGAFKNYLPVYADRWLSTLNLVMDLPFTPLSLYGDAGLASITSNSVQIAFNNFYYGSGLSVKGGKLLQFYFPVAGSNFENGLPASFKDFTRNIRFSLNLAAYNPFRLLTDTLK
jgi:hypothetical protein